MTEEQEMRLRALAEAKYRAWEHYQALGAMNSLYADPLVREHNAIAYSLAGARAAEAHAAFDRAVAALHPAPARTAAGG